MAAAAYRTAADKNEREAAAVTAGQVMDGSSPSRRSPAARHQPDRQLVPARHGLATPGLRWLAMISTCLAKIRRPVPASGDCGWEGNFASNACYSGKRRGCRQSAAHRGLRFLEFKQQQCEQ
jgi:hypothetical protein